MSHTVSVKHTFESGHRLPHLPGKCENLHGHSWAVEVSVYAPRVGENGTIVEFGKLKRELRDFVDKRLDHGLMLGGDDPLVKVLQPYGKVFVFDSHSGDDAPNEFVDGLYWPSVEGVAEVIARFMTDALPRCGGVPQAIVSVVNVAETPTNVASWISPSLHPWTEAGWEFFGEGSVQRGIDRDVDSDDPDYPDTKAGI